METGSLFSKRAHSIMQKATLSSLPTANCQEIQATNHNPVTKRSLAFVDGRGARALDSDVFQVSQQFHES